MEINRAEQQTLPRFNIYFINSSLLEKTNTANSYRECSGG